MSQDFTNLLKLIAIVVFVFVAGFLFDGPAGSNHNPVQHNQGGSNHSPLSLSPAEFVVVAS